MVINNKTLTLDQAREAVAGSTAYRRLEKLFDDGAFTQIDSFTVSADGFSEAVAGYGTVDGQGVYAYAQNCDASGGAMSRAQAAKIKKLYDLAKATGEPVVAMYDSIGGRLDEGAELLGAYGDVLKYSNNLSGVVPQLSLVLGKCCGTQALIAAQADVVIMTEKAEMSLSTNGQDASAKHNAEHGTAHIVTADEDEAIEKAKQLLTLLPQNNLSGAYIAYDSIEAAGTPSGNSATDAALAVADADSAVELQAGYGKAIKTVLATVNGLTVGLVASAEKTIDGKSASKAARFIRFCDAFSIPVVSFIDATDFKCIKSAAKLSSAYSEATSAKITFVTGDAVGAVYIAAAGTGGAADMTFAYENACISPLGAEAAAVIMLGDDFGGALKDSKDPVADKKIITEQFKREKLNAMNAAAAGYVDDIIQPDRTRDVLVSALDMLSNKRVSTLPKKHNNLYI